MLLQFIIVVLDATEVGQNTSMCESDLVEWSLAELMVSFYRFPTISSVSGCTDWHFCNI